MRGPEAHRGFTLVEAIVALALTGVLVGMVFSVFLAQNDFYTDVVRRSRAHDTARNVAELVAADVRAATASGVVDADSLTLVVRTPASVGTVCRIFPNFVTGHFVQGRSGVDTDAVAGYGVRSADDVWRFYPASWDDMYQATGQPIAGYCADEGMDTTGLAGTSYLRINGPGGSQTFPPTVGGALVIHEEVELSLAPSQLRSGYVGIFRGPSGDTPVEFASSLGPDTHFRYRLQGEDTFSPSVDSGDLDRINSVRITVHALEGIEGDGRDRYDHVLTRDVPLRNE